jgi:protein downstream neighbor of Son
LDRVARFSGRGDSGKLDSAVPSITEAAKTSFKKVEKCSENALWSVAELHIGDDKQAGSDKFDMVMGRSSFAF